VLAAYGSLDALGADFVLEDNQGDVAQQAYLLGRRLAVPDIKDGESALTLAIDLSKDDAFKKKRSALFEWQASALAQKLTPEQAVEEIAQLTEEYNKCVRAAVTHVNWKFAFMIGGVALGLAGTGLGNPLGSATAILALVQFLTLDRQPVIEPGKSAAVAMFHDIETRLGLRLSKP
jgi:hypothetical protein